MILSDWCAGGLGGVSKGFYWRSVTRVQEAQWVRNLIALVVGSQIVSVGKYPEPSVVEPQSLKPRTLNPEPEP